MADMLDCTEVPLDEGALAGSAKSQSHLIFRFDLGGITALIARRCRLSTKGSASYLLSVFCRSFVGLLSVFCRSFVGEDGFRRDKSRERFGLCLEFIAFFLRKRVDAPG
jgi:hypothetical protein